VAIGPRTDAASAEEVGRLTRIQDAETIAAILGTGASYSEVEQAFLWASGQGEQLGKSEHPLQGTAAMVYDILMKHPAFMSEPDARA
jgi:hypothetical protein